MRTLIAKFIAAVALVAAVAAAQAATTLNQYGITWTWQEDRQTGQYANGDWWVAGPITLTGITGTDSDGTVRASLSGRNTSWFTNFTAGGTMFNPVGGSYPAQGFDSRQGGYDETLNMARKSGAPLSVSNTRVAAAGTSIVSTSANLAQTVGDRPMLADMAILTVVSSAPAAGAFRPPYQGTDKSFSHNKSELDYTRLKRVTIPGMSAPTGSSMARPWMLFALDYNQARAWAPTNNSPEYDRDLGELVQVALQELHYDYSDAQKETPYIRLVQLGIDIFGAANTARDDTTYEVPFGNTWVKTPIIIASLALSDTAMAWYCDPTHTITLAPFYYTSGPYKRWAIDRSTNYVNSLGVNFVANDAKLAGGADGNRQRLTYTPNMIGMPEWDGGHTDYSTGAGSNFGVVYRNVRHYGLVGHALNLILYTGAKARNGNDAFFDLFDRQYGAYKHVVTGDVTNPSYVTTMWELYRSLGGAMWNQTPLLGVGWVTEDGTQFILEATDNISIGSGGSGGLTITASGGPVTPTYVSGAGTPQLTFNLSRAIGPTETLGTYSYTNPGNGIEAYVGGADVAAVTNYPFTNYAAGETGGGGGRTVGGSAPTAPSSLSASVVSSTQINLTWSDNSSDETGFVVERSLNNSSWTNVATTAANATSQAATGLTASTLYYFRVRATNGSGSSSNATASATTSAGGSPPASAPVARIRRASAFSN